MQSGPAHPSAQLTRHPRSCLRNPWHLLLPILAAGGCGTDPDATLIITLDPVPRITNAETVTLTGTVTRTPPRNIVIFVRAQGGAGSPVDTVIGGMLSLPVRLNPNTTNTITLTPLDPAGGSGADVTVTIRHDGGAPGITRTTPADGTTGITGTPQVQVTLSEASVIAAGGGIRLTLQGATVPGSTTIAGDSVSLTFTPAGPLSPNAIYRIGLHGVSDVAGNIVPASASACFVTSAAGAGAIFDATDATGDVYTLGSAPPASQPDLVGARLVREGLILSGLIQFSEPRTFSRTASTRANVFIELDVDLDSTTGWVTLKDTLFISNGPPLDTLGTGTRAEYVIALTPLESIGDSGYVGRYTAPLQFQVAQRFIPGVCAAYMGFMVPFSVVGSTSGRVNMSLLATAGSGSSLFADPIPTKGHLDLDLPDPDLVSPFPVPVPDATPTGRNP